MEIINIAVGKIRPDPNQPRKTIEKSQIDDMAQNMKYQGVINPIEVDKDLVIVTGEQRWWAAKKAGFKKVPIKILEEIQPYDRFMRQVSENVHQNTMTEWDTAVAVKKLQECNGTQRATRELGEMLGKSHHWVEMKLSLLKESKKVQEVMKKPGAISPSLLNEINERAPEEYRNLLKNKLIKGELGTGRGVRALAKALELRPDKTNELLSKNYRGLSTEKMYDVVTNIAPTPTQQIENTAERGEKLRAELRTLTSRLETTTLNDYAPLEAPEIKLLLSKLGVAITKFLDSYKRELPNKETYDSKMS